MIQVYEIEMEYFPPLPVGWSLFAPFLTHSPLTPRVRESNFMYIRILI